MTGDPPATTENILVGALLVVVASACFAVVGLFVQLSSPHASHAVIVFVAFAVGASFVIPLGLFRGREFLATQRPGLMALRSVVGLVQIATLFIAVQSIPLLDASLLREAAPLWVPLLAALLYRERMAAVLWIPILCGFAGMAMVLHPHFDGAGYGYLFALANGFLFGLQSVLTRRLRVVGEPTLRVLFWLYLICATLTAGPAAATYTEMPVSTWFYLIASGFLMLMSTTCLVTGFARGPAYILAPFGYSVVAFSALIDWAVFGRLPSLLTVAGIVVIVGAGVLLLILTRRSASH